jgi:CheY-like chemotaxis protein
MGPVVGLEGRRVAQQGRFLVRPKILIIDDSVDSWNLLSTIVKAHDMYPVWAADGTQAMAAAHFQHPQAILLDLGMPGGNGFLILDRLKSNPLLSNIPVIVVTVRDRKEAEEKARQLGAIAYVSKPIQADALMASIQTVLATRDGAPVGVAPNTDLDVQVVQAQEIN